MRRTIGRSLLAACAVAASLTGCSAGPLSDASNSIGEKLKSMPESLGGLPPDAPRGPAIPYQYPPVHDMPPLKLVARNQDKDVRYTFADPYKCRCLYVGGPKEYSAYQRLVTEQQIAQERLWAEEDRMNWGLWDPWYWR